MKETLDNLRSDEVKILNKGSTPAGSTASSGGGGSCPYSKDNVSWGEYQATIPMPAGTSPPYTVVITFDADTTIVMT